MPEILLEEPHESQLKILSQKKRFNLVKCGRRFGKTSLIKYLVLGATARNYIGIWFPTYGDLVNVWEEILSQLFDVIDRVKVAERKIYFKGGGRVDFWSMDNPDAGRGNGYHVAIVDEAAKAPKFRLAWTQTIRPTLTDYQGDGWIFSTPKGKLNYFYTLQEEKAKDPEWCIWHFTTYDNPFISRDEIEAAKQSLDTHSFRQEYMAEDIDENEKPFLYSFDKSHIGKTRYNPNLELIFSFDFNKDPCTCIVGQRINITSLHIIDAVSVYNGSTPEVCEKLLSKYGAEKCRQAKITGDATGQSRNPLVRGNVSHYVLIQQTLKTPNNRFNIRKANISHINSRILCNSFAQNGTLVISEEIKELIRECELAAVDDNGKLIKTNEFGLHFFDCLRYMIDSEFYDWIEKPQKYGTKA
jgi:hypothetical protein